MGGGTYTKTLTVSLNQGATKATAASAGESAVNDATVFVYQNNVTEGTRTLFDRVYTETQEIELSMLFSDQTEYTYDLNVYANMGDLESEPAATEVSFEKESLDAFQAHGTCEGIGKDFAGTVSVMLQRYVSRIVVTKVNLFWNHEGNGAMDFTLKAVYIANAGDKAEGGVKAYNVDGVYTSSDKDALLYSEVNEVIAPDGSLATPHYLYAYGSDDLNLVLVADYAGQVRYYSLPLDVAGNAGMNLVLTVRQIGSSEPLGGLSDECLTVAPVNIGFEDYPDDYWQSDFNGEVSELDTQVKIYAIDGNLYTLNEWISFEKEESDAVGVAVTDGEHSFVIHPTANQKGDTKWSSNYSVAIDGVVTTTDRTAAKADFAGAANTAAILAAVEAGTIEDAPAAQYAAGITFANGKSGYLPSAGELTLAYQHLSAINQCMAAIGGTEFLTTSYWSSTQCSDINAWEWNSASKFVSSDLKTRIGSVRVFAAL